MYPARPRSQRSPYLQEYRPGTARGEYVMFLDSDDLLAPDSLKTRFGSFARYPDHDFLVFNTLFFNKKPGDVDLIWNVDEGDNDRERFVAGDTVWSVGGAVFKREFLLRNGLNFDNALNSLQDIDFHVRVLSLSPRYRKLFHLKPDYYCRRHQHDSISQASTIKKDARLYNQYIFYKKMYDLLLQGSSRKEKQMVLKGLLRVARWYFLRKEVFKANRIFWWLAKNRRIGPAVWVKLNLAFAVELLEARFIPGRLRSGALARNLGVSALLRVPASKLGAVKYSALYGQQQPVHQSIKPD